MIPCLGEVNGDIVSATLAHDSPLSFPLMLPSLDVESLSPTVTNVNISFPIVRLRPEPRLGALSVGVHARRTSEPFLHDITDKTGSSCS